MKRRGMLLHLSPLAAVGGCEMNCLRLIEGLPGWNHRVLVFDERGPMSTRWKQAGAKVEHLAAWRSGSRSFESALRAWTAAEIAPSGILYWSTSRLPVVLRALWNWDMPWVVHLGNPAPTGVIPGVRRGLQELTSRPARRISLAACSRQVALSHAKVRYFRRFPVEVIYNPVGGGITEPNTVRLLPSGSRPRIGMVARLDPIKDHATLVRALPHVLASHPDATLELAGDGSLRPVLEKLVRQFGLSERVKFLGFVEVPPRLAEWDLYVHATTKAEGMGTAVAEAMTAGLPCVATDLPVMREVCGDNGAVFVRPGDAKALGRTIAQLLSDHPRRLALASAARERAAKMFALPQVADAYLRLLGQSTP